MALTSGAKLGPYEILLPLGAGGMGEVYRARDTRLERDVALKVLPEAFARDAERTARFEREARAVAALNHPNILAIYDIGSHQGVPFLVTELLEGETLRERLSSGPLPVRKALDVAEQAARGVAAAHERGIIHRDLKPANIFLTHDGRVKVLDFGLAKLTQRNGTGLDETQSPIAQQFAYVTDRNGPQEIWLRSAQEGWSRPVVTPDQFSDPTVNLCGPTFSPDGSRIAYARLSHDNGMWIWISSTGGGAPVRLTHESAAVGEGPPAWSPDGNWLAYERYERGSPELVKFRVGSSDAPVVLKKEAGDFVPAWSPTGDWITFLSANDDVLLVSPDGKSERSLGPLRTDYLLWSRDGKTLYGIRPNKDQHEILFSLDVVSGRQKDITDLGTEFIPGGPLSPSNRYSLAPDGKSFALSIRKYRSDLWMLENFNSHPGWLWKW
jgi:serine/threonine protein kinase